MQAYLKELDKEKAAYMKSLDEAKVSYVKSLEEAKSSYMKVVRTLISHIAVACCKRSLCFCEGLQRGRCQS